MFIFGFQFGMKKIWDNTRIKYVYLILVTCKTQDLAFSLFAKYELDLDIFIVLLQVNLKICYHQKCVSFKVRSSMMEGVKHLILVLLSFSFTLSYWCWQPQSSVSSRILLIKVCQLSSAQEGIFDIKYSSIFFSVL